MEPAPAGNIKSFASLLLRPKSRRYAAVGLCTSLRRQSKAADSKGSAFGRSLRCKPQCGERNILSVKAVFCGGELSAAVQTARGGAFCKKKSSPLFSYLMPCVARRERCVVTFLLVQESNQRTRQRGALKRRCPPLVSPRLCCSSAPIQGPPWPLWRMALYAYKKGASVGEPLAPALGI